MIIGWLAVAGVAGWAVGYAAVRVLRGRVESAAEDAWRRSARSLSPGDRVRVAVATNRGRGVRDPRLARLSAYDLMCRSGFELTCRSVFGESSLFSS